MTPELEALPAVYAIVVVISVIALTAALTLIGYFIRDIKATMTAKDTAHDKAIEALSKDFNDWRVHSAETYVAREDFVRSMVKLQAMIDDQGKVLRSVARDVNQLIGGKGAPHAG